MIDLRLAWITVLLVATCLATVGVLVGIVGVFEWFLSGRFRWWLSVSLLAITDHRRFEPDSPAYGIARSVSGFASDTLRSLARKYPGRFALPPEVAREIFELTYPQWPLARQLSSNGAYETFITDDASHLVKLASEQSGHGDCLRKEAQILDFLQLQARVTSYGRYLPNTPKQLKFAGAAASVFELPENHGFAHKSPAWTTGLQLVEHHRFGLAPQHVAWIFNRLLEVLGFVHREGYAHCAIQPQHLWIDLQSHGLQLVDWSHATSLLSEINNWPVSHESYYPKTICRSLPVYERQRIPGGTKSPIALPGLDIYSAAKCMQFLAHGHWLSTNQFPSGYPKRMQRFFAACLLESDCMVPCDAWELREEFGELLRDLFGPPQFHPLSI